MTLRTVAFGDLRTGTWGAALSLHPDLPSLAVVSPELAAMIPAEVGGDASSAHQWRIAGDGLDLLVSPEAALGAGPPGGDATPAAPPPAPVQDAREAGDFDQLVTVRGYVGEEHPRAVDSLGCRSERVDAVYPGRFALVRAICGWFAPGEGFALVAVRPRRATGHGDEHLTATVFSDGQPVPVAEPRLSTAYTEEGQPVRATLELWFAEEGRDQGEDEQPVQYPHRAAGGASGSGTTYDQTQLELRVQPFRWWAQAREGAGMYVLVRAR